MVSQGFNRSRMEILKTLLRLRQICCHLDLLKLPGLKSEAPSAKLDLFFELLDEASTAATASWSSASSPPCSTSCAPSWTRSLRYCYLDGSTKDRMKRGPALQHRPRTSPIFLISLKAGGTGLNLTGADMVIHYDPWWNPAVEDQATDRAYRIGQKRTVYSVKLIARDTVEEKVLAMQLSAVVPDQTLVVVSARHPAVFSDEGAAFVNEMSERLLRIPGVQGIKSLTHSGRPIRRGMGLVIESFIPDRATPEQWKTIRGRILKHPMSRNVLVSDRGHMAVFLVFLQRDLSEVEEIRRLHDDFRFAVMPFRSRCEDIALVAFPFVELEMHDDIAHDVRRFAWMVALLIAAILAVTFRSFWLILLLLIQSAIALAMPPVILSLLGTTINLYTGLLFPLAGGVHLTFLAHLYIPIRRALAAGLDEREASARAVARTVKPSAYAMLTTVLGFLSLLMHDVGLVRDLAVGGAGCIFSAFVLAYLGPVLIAGPRRLRQDRGLADSGAECVVGPLHRLLAAVTYRLRWPILIAYAAFLAWAVGPAGRVRTDIRALEFLRPGSESRQTLELLNGELGGFNIFQARIHTGAKGGIQELSNLQYMEKVRRFAAAVPGVADAYAYSQVFTMMNHIWEGEKPGSDILPANPLTLFTFRNLVNSTKMLYEDQFVGEGLESALFLVRTRDMPARDYLRIIEQVTEYAQANAPKGVTFVPVEGIHSVLEGDRRMVRSQSGSIGFTLAAVFICLLIAWRRMLPGVQSIAANLAPVAVTFAAMGLLDYPLNSITIMVASIVLGIAVDDSIHLLAMWRQVGLEPGLDPRARLARLFASKLLPVACTSSVLGSCFGLFIVSSFPPVMEFGILCALALGAAFLSATFVLPALFAVARRDPVARRANAGGAGFA
jgi:predicted RND superfamily exporter protein